MAIKKRSFNPTPQLEDAVTTVEDASPNRVIDEDEIHVLRMGTYTDGCRGRQRHPKEVPFEELLAGIRHVQNTGKDAKIEEFYRQRVRSPLTAIRAFMVLANDGPRKANDDESTSHPLWLFRHGKNPFYGKLRNENAEADDD